MFSDASEVDYSTSVCDRRSRGDDSHNIRILPAKAAAPTLKSILIPNPKLIEALSAILQFVTCLRFVCCIVLFWKGSEI